MSQKSTRLGDLLVEQRLISALQLREAIELQEMRLKGSSFADVSSITGATENRELGEILIELGFISRHQLTSSLSWQRNLRRATKVMVFIAPLLTAACGGGAAGASSSSAANPQSNNVSSQTISNQNSPTKSSAKSSIAKSVATSAASSSNEVVVTQPKSAANSSAPSSKAVSSNALSSKATSSLAVSSLAVSSLATSSKTSSSKPASSSAASSINSSGIDGPVQLYWNIPTEREDGERLDVTEISGYEVRYKLKSDTEFQSVSITDGYTDAYYFNYLQGDYEFQIATYDKNGLYSSFVAITPH